jgi:hypothetical protein
MSRIDCSAFSAFAKAAIVPALYLGFFAWSLTLLPHA